MQTDVVQAFEPLSKRWIKISTVTGRQIATKKSFGPWANVRMTGKQPKTVEPYKNEGSDIEWWHIKCRHNVIADGFQSADEALSWLERYK